MANVEQAAFRVWNGLAEIVLLIRIINLVSVFQIRPDDAVPVRVGDPFDVAIDEFYVSTACFRTLVQFNDERYAAVYDATVYFLRRDAFDLAVYLSSELTI